MRGICSRVLTIKFQRNGNERSCIRVSSYLSLATVQILLTLFRVITATWASEQPNYCIAKALSVTWNNIYGEWQLRMQGIKLFTFVSLGFECVKVFEWKQHFNDATSTIPMFICCCTAHFRLFILPHSGTFNFCLLRIVFVLFSHTYSERKRKRPAPFAQVHTYLRTNALRRVCVLAVHCWHCWLFCPHAACSVFYNCT